MNMIIGRREKNLMVAKHKARKGNICWIVVYCQQGLHASRIKSVHLFTAMQMSFSWMNRKLTVHLQSDGPNLFYGSKDSFVSSSVCSKGWTKATKVIYWTPSYVQSGSSSFLSFSSVKQNLILREKVDGAWIGSFAASFFSSPPSFANCFQSH